MGMRYLSSMLLLLFLSGVANAAPSDIYQVTIPVSSQDQKVKLDAMREGLGIVLVRASANEGIQDVDAIKKQLQAAENYVEQYQYRKGPTPEMRYMLQVHYDPQSVKQLLKRAGVANAGASRPLVLVWLTEPNVVNKHIIVGQQSPGDILYTFSKQARSRRTDGP